MLRIQHGNTEVDARVSVRAVLDGVVDGVVQDQGRQDLLKFHVHLGVGEKVVLGVMGLRQVLRVMGERKVLTERVQIGLHAWVETRIKQQASKQSRETQ